MFCGSTRPRFTEIPPGVGEPFTSWPLDTPGSVPRRSCVLVGAHDPRKNARFLLDLWPEVRRRTGLELHLTCRSFVTTRPAAPRAQVADGLIEHIDPTDTELVKLYAGALCLLWPSLCEGYGLPL